MAGDIIFSGYKDATLQTLIDASKLNSLADDCATGNESGDTVAEIDNTANKYKFMDVFLSLASVTVSGAGALVYVYVFPSDGNASPAYPHFVVDESTSANNLLPVHYCVGSMEFNVATSTAQMQMLRGIIIPQGKFRTAIYNALGVAFPSSGNTVSYKRYTDAYT